MAHSISTFSVFALSLLLICSTVIESGSAFGAPAASSTASSPPAPPGQNPEGRGATIEDNPAAAQKALQCGTTAADAAKRARLALERNDAGSERAALRCLIDAVD